MGLVTAKLIISPRLYLFTKNSLSGIIFAWAFYRVAGMTIACRAGGLAGKSAKRVTRGRTWARNWNWKHCLCSSNRLLADSDIFRLALLACVSRFAFCTANPLLLRARRTIYQHYTNAVLAKQTNKFYSDKGLGRGGGGIIVILRYLNQQIVFIVKTGLCRVHEFLWSSMKCLTI